MINIEDMFVRRVLKCFGKRKSTQEEIEEIYDMLYPLPKIPTSIHDLVRVFRHKHSLHKRSVDITHILYFLHKEGYCAYELICFTEHVTPHDIRIYFLTEKGQMILNKKK